MFFLLKKTCKVRDVIKIKAVKKSVCDVLVKKLNTVYTKLPNSGLVP